MQHEGNILKMRAELTSPINYFFRIGNDEIPMNPLLGKAITLKFTGKINCISCGKKTKTSFNQGFCYNCLRKAPEASETIIRPELSKAHFGIARDMEWAEKHDLIAHYVYLAVAGGLKVGVTREHQIPTRWIDQGAGSAIKLAKTPNRHIAGVIEVWLKKYFSDKANWRAMLQNRVIENIDLVQEKNKAAGLLPAELQRYVEKDNQVTMLEYPVLDSPEKIKSVTFDKQAEISGKLTGIKGQYLIFENQSVLNIRKHNGYFLQVTY
ncbi:MAG: DUF2797 domain-containing protein [Chlorobi bacterium]|nr:DUF2797 domain-containing protein [Chlorobiota bacterium]